MKKWVKTNPITIKIRDKMDQKIVEECKKCAESPWYFATKYLTIDGKPFTTLLSEEEFNDVFFSRHKKFK